MIAAGNSGQNKTPGRSQHAIRRLVTPGATGGGVRSG